MKEENEASTSTLTRNTLFRCRAEMLRRIEPGLSVEGRRNKFDAVDLIAAVEGLHELSPQQLSKLIRESGNNVIRHTAENGSHIQVDVERFARYLPLHLIAVIMAWDRDKATFKHLLCGILLLHSMCDLASRVPKIEQILLDDVKVSEQLIDLVIYLLVLLGEYGQENDNIRNDIVLLHSALVACSLKLLTVIVSPQYQEVAQVLIAHYKVNVFIDSALSAVCTDVSFLQAKVSTELQDFSANTSPTAKEIVNHLCQQCDSSLLFLQLLCQQKLFRECIVKNKEFCHSGGVLVLVQAVMNLKKRPSHIMPSTHVPSISQLKSRALSILLHLCEAESVSYLDEVASSPGSQNLAKSIALQVLDLLKNMFGIYSKLSTVSSVIFSPRGQLELNAMRLADVLSDDSNFRSFIMINFTETLAAIFLLPHGEFLSAWCSSDLPVCEDDATLDVPRESYAHLRTSLLIKVIANLHCFVPDVCQDEKDLFLNKFLRFVQKESKEPSVGLPSSASSEKITTVCKNIRLLLSHAESLIPRFLNEDDVQLLRLFISQFDSRIASAASEDHYIQDTTTMRVPSSPLHREVAPALDNNDANKEEMKLENGGLQEVEQLGFTEDGNCQRVDGEISFGRAELDKSDISTINLSEIDKDFRIVETSGSDSSPRRGKENIHQMDADRIKRTCFEEIIEDEKGDILLSDEKQQRKRKRTIMNDKQIALIEAALVEEPDMHRSSSSLRSWAEKLSLHGAEVTTSRLKNWLNNRKAKLARAAKDGRASYEGDNLDKQGGLGHFDSPMSPDDVHLPSSAKVIVHDSIDTALASNANEDFGGSLNATGEIMRSGRYIKSQQYAMLIDENGKEVGKGKVFQVQGNWYGRNLEQSGMCIVDIIELSIDRSAKLLHPMEVTGDSFDEAEKRLGLMRVLWDLNKLFPLTLQ